METKLITVRQKDIRRKVRERFLRPRLAEMTYWRDIQRYGVSTATESLLLDVSRRELKAWGEFGKSIGRPLLGQIGASGLGTSGVSLESVTSQYFHMLSGGAGGQVGSLVASFCWVITSIRAKSLGSRGFIFRGDPLWEGVPSSWEQLPWVKDYILPTEHILRCWPEPVIPDKF